MIRTARASDASAIVHICHETGYMGEAVGTRFGDRVLFAHLFALPYLTFAGGSCLVAVAAEDVIGYAVAVPDTQAFERWFGAAYRSKIVSRILSHTLWTSPYDVRRVMQWSRGANGASEGDLLKDYPAHLHMNILPAFQRQGIGSEFMATTLSGLKVMGVGGVHLTMSSRNLAAKDFYEKVGFRLLFSSEGSLWGEPGVRSLCLGLRFDY